jgi:hypothetical protein
MITSHHRKLPVRILFLVTLLMLAFFWAWTRNRTRLFIGHHDWDNINWVSAARNYQAYGFGRTGLNQVTTPYYPAPPDEWEVNYHHPPGISLLTWFGVSLFGLHEFTARLMPLFASMVAAAALFTLARRAFGTPIALLSLFFFSFTPLMIYYSAKIGHEQFILPLMLITLIVWGREWESTSTWSGVGLFCLGLAGGMIGWAWYLFLVLLGAGTLIARGKKRVWRAWPLWAGACAALCVVVGAGLWHDGARYTAVLTNAFLKRTGMEAQYEPPTNVIPQILSRFLWLPTVVVTALGVIGLVGRLRAADRGFSDYLVALPGLTTVVYDTVFWEATYYHDYLIYYLVASLAIWSGVVMWRLMIRYRPVRPTWIAALSVLVVTFLIASGYASWQIHNVDHRILYEWAMAAKAHTAQGEVVALDLEQTGPHISYYAQRRVIFEQPPERALGGDPPARWGFYISCLPESEGETRRLLGESGLPYEVDAQGCYLVDLRP